MAYMIYTYVFMGTQTHRHTDTTPCRRPRTRGAFSHCARPWGESKRTERRQPEPQTPRCPRARKRLRRALSATANPRRRLHRSSLDACVCACACLHSCLHMCRACLKEICAMFAWKKGETRHLFRKISSNWTCVCACVLLCVCACSFVYVYSIRYTGHSESHCSHAVDITDMQSTCTHARGKAICIHSLCNWPGCWWLKQQLLLRVHAEHEWCLDWLHVLIDCMSWLIGCLDWLHVLIDCMSWLIACLDWLDSLEWIVCMHADPYMHTIWSRKHRRTYIHKLYAVNITNIHAHACTLIFILADTRNYLHTSAHAHMWWVRKHTSTWHTHEHDTTPYLLYRQRPLRMAPPVAYSLVARNCMSQQHPDWAVWRMSVSRDSASVCACECKRYVQNRRNFHGNLPAKECVLYEDDAFS
jgi:hypothetical protein